MSRILRAVTATGAAFVMALGATPAAASPADVDFYVAPSGRAITANCSLAAGASTDPRYVNWVVQASAFSAGPSPSVATSVTCTVYDTLNPSWTYGGASGALPGPLVVAVGQATVPVGRVPAVCVKGSAIFLDGSSISSPKPCP
jgi:hypothetical protein